LYERKTVRMVARILDGGQWYDCQIMNISVGGAKVRFDRRFGQGASVRLEIGSLGQYGATVAWQSSEELGVRFNHDPLEMADVVMGLAMYG
jgi:hypothetical protein